MNYTRPGRKQFMGRELALCQPPFRSSCAVHRGITSTILPLSASYVHSNWKVSGRPSFQLSLVTSTNNRPLRALIELERSWLHELELHELITLAPVPRHGHGRSLQSVWIYRKFPVISPARSISVARYKSNCQEDECENAMYDRQDESKGSLSGIMKRTGSVSLFQDRPRRSSHRISENLNIKS